MELKARDESSITKATTTPATAEALEELVATRPVPIKGRRRNLGRQARKRRKKYLEIEAAFVAAATAASVETNINTSVVTTSSTTTTTTTTTMESTEEAGDGDQEVLGSNATTTTASKTTVLPTDRGYVLDDVRRRTVLSEADRHDLIRQLGYLPGNALRVVARVEDAFSSDDLQRLVAAAAMVTTTTTTATTATPKTKTTTTTSTQGESAGATDAANTNTNINTNTNTNTNSNSNLNNDSDNHSTTNTSGTTTNCNDMQTNERKTKAMASMIQTMMKEPLVIKLYPLVLRDESSSTKRRRKRRREETEDHSTDHHNGISTNKNPPANTASAGTTGTREGATSSAAGTVALPQTTPLMEPFPTIYWVTHPLIKALISKLELDRVNVQFEQRLLDEETERKKSEESHPTDHDSNSSSSSNNNSNTVVTCHSSTPLESMKRAHISYGRERRGLLSSRDMEYVKGRRWYDETSSSPSSSSSPPKTKTATAAPFSDGCGVAGIRNPKAVKCLHAHAAHYWSGNNDNVVGFWVWERLKSGCSFFSG
jgi:hypothetical protein